MANTVYGPYTAHNWIAGDAINATRLNNIETQSSLAFHGFNPDLIGAGFFLSGCAATGTVGTTTVNIASGVAYILMTDGTLGRITVGSTTQTTATPSTTYHLYLQPDGTFFWSTAGSGQQTNSLHIADVATNGSGQISTITDLRPTGASLLPNMIGLLTLGPAGVTTPGNVTSQSLVLTGRAGFGGASPAITDKTGTLELWSAGSGSAAGIAVMAWTGAATVIPLSIGGRFDSASSWFDSAGILNLANAGGVGSTFCNIGEWPGHGGVLRYRSGLSGGFTLGHSFHTWNASSEVIPLSVGDQFEGASTWIGGTGKFGAVAGQATAGSFGVPVIVAQALRTHVTSTATQTILSYTPPVAGVFRLNIYAFMGGTLNGSVTIHVSIFDPDNVGGGYGGNIYGMDAQDNIWSNLNPVTMSNIGQVLIPAYTFANDATHAIVVSYTNATATPNDYVTVVLERLA